MLHNIHRYKRDYSQPDIIPGELFKILPWSTKAAVFGSYALKRFTGAVWEHDDIDIALYTDADEFYTICESVVATGIFQDTSKLNGNAGLHTNEKFGQRVKETQTYVTKTGKKVQFVRIEPDGSPLIDTLAMETSAPCCISMTYSTDGNEVFHMARRGAIVTSDMKVDGSCDKICTEEGRIAKYFSRGYKYVRGCHSSYYASRDPSEF